MMFKNYGTYGPNVVATLPNVPMHIFSLLQVLGPDYGTYGSYEPNVVATLPNIPMHIFSLLQVIAPNF